MGNLLLVVSVEHEKHIEECAIRKQALGATVLDVGQIRL